MDTGYKPQINRIAAFAIAFSLMEGEESLLHNLIIFDEIAQRPNRENRILID